MFVIRTACAVGAVAAFAVSALTQPAITPAGGGEHPFLPKDEMTDAQRESIQSQLRASIEQLEREGKFLDFSPQAVPLAWPIRKAAGNSDFNVDGISNFVDQNLSFPDQVLDYNCGNRSYDQASGYNHRGIDIFTWPFSWRKMDLNEVEVVAAAPGTIIFKSDGNFDRSCGFNSNTWNAVYVRHSDNSVAWYGHLKNGSLTTKAVGETVAAGEKLGIVGSSGNSTGPHLHFELYNAAGQLQDPYQGPCNSLNNFSWWAAQPAYRVSRINKLLTQSAGPGFPACPLQETTNEKSVFRPGETLVTAGYFRDQMVGQQTQYSILRPDGSTFQSWIHNSPNTYSASFWWWSWQIPVNAPSGIWKLRATFNSETYERTFVVPEYLFDYDVDRRSDLSVRRTSDNIWYLLRSGGGFTGLQWGTAGDRMAPADYDGDGRTDIAVYRPSEGRWYIVFSGNLIFHAVNWGAPGDLPVPADRDGDGRADLVLYRESDTTWYTRFANGNLHQTAFGAAGDRPIRGDFDVDGRADIAVYRPSNNTWYMLRSHSGFTAQTWGEPGDIPVPADYDGDGAADIAVFRPSTGQWFRARSSLGFDVLNWGEAGDVPAAADYDGDGKSDAAVFRPSTGTWYLLRSTAGILVTTFGQTGDVPTQSSFLY